MGRAPAAGMTKQDLHGHEGVEAEVEAEAAILHWALAVEEAANMTAAGVLAQGSGQETGLTEDAVENSEGSVEAADLAEAVAEDGGLPEQMVPVRRGVVPAARPLLSSGSVAQLFQGSKCHAPRVEWRMDVERTSVALAYGGRRVTAR